MASHYEQFFRDADKDGSGYLTVDELIKLLRDRGYKASDEKIRVSSLSALCRLPACSVGPRICKFGTGQLPVCQTSVAYNCSVVAITSRLSG